MARTDREHLGRIVRETWVKWAKKQDKPKEHWLEPWEKLDEPMKEVDRLIGEAIAADVLTGPERRIKILEAALWHVLEDVEEVAQVEQIAEEQLKAEGEL